jgi:chromosome partitioning protein
MRDGIDEDLLGINEIADLAGVSRQAVANWRSRFSGFPKPIAELKSGPVFRRSQVRAWLRTRRVPMAHVVSTINLKGGVGKTHTTVALGEVYSALLRKKVLVIDLDPQTNATTMLIGEESWAELNKQDHTLARLFRDALDPDNPKFDLGKTLQKRVSDVQSANTIDLLPSSLDLIDVQDRLATVPSGRFYAVNPIDLLTRAVRPIVDDYDIVLIDCPPNLGVITLNGLRMSNGYVIPTIPDVLSTYGIPQIVKRVREFSQQIAEPIEPLGIVVSKYREQSTVHQNVVKRLQEGKDAPLFKTIIKENNQIASAAEFSAGRRTLKQKYGYQWQVDAYEAIAKEIWEALEG